LLLDWNKFISHDLKEDPMLYGIILAAGKGSRFGEEKQSVLLNGLPLYQHSVNTFLSCPEFKQIYLICPPGKLKNFQHPGINVLEGGQERKDSVQIALRAIQETSACPAKDHVIIHDSARPLVKPSQLKLLANALTHYPAATLGYKITDALKKADEEQKAFLDLDRQNIWAVTTPQGFDLQKLVELYAKYQDPLYDETHLFIRENLPVKIVDTGRYNIKVTYPEDLKVAQLLLQNSVFLED